MGRVAAGRNRGQARRVERDTTHQPGAVPPPYPRVVAGTPAYEIEDIDFDLGTVEVAGTHMHYFVQAFHDMNADQNMTDYVMVDTVASSEQRALEQAKAVINRRHYRVNNVTVHEPKGDHE